MANPIRITISFIRQKRLNPLYWWMIFCLLRKSDKWIGLDTRVILTLTNNDLNFKSINKTSVVLWQRRNGKKLAGFDKRSGTSGIIGQYTTILPSSQGVAPHGVAWLFQIHPVKAIDNEHKVHKVSEHKQSWPNEMGYTLVTKLDNNSDNQR